MKANISDQSTNEKKPEDPINISEQLSILHVVDSLEVGGLERTVVRLAVAQKKAGHIVSIATVFRNGPLTEALQNSDIPVHCLEKRPGFDFKSVRKLRKISKNKIDVVHTHNPVPHYYATLATLGIKLHRISTRHDMGVHLKRKRMEDLYRLALKKTHAVVLVCDAARERFINESIVPENLASVVYNGIEPTEARDRQGHENKQLRQKLGLPETGPIIGSVGRLNQVKNYETLINAFAILTRVSPESSLVIVGDGPERQSLQELIKTLGLEDRVKLLGERNDIDDLLAQFDVFALTSKTEGFSVALVEAAWAGLPIIATDVGGNREIVDHGTTGFLVQVGDSSAVAEKLKFLLTDREFHRIASRMIRSKAETNWSLESMADNYLEIYKQARNNEIRKRN
jgi:glycosyltransferase involved in cell wall biosynthesis